MKDITKEKLTELLEQAERAHSGYEEELGHRDQNWPKWYADFIINEIKNEQ